MVYAEFVSENWQAKERYPELRNLYGKLIKYI